MDNSILLQVVLLGYKQRGVFMMKSTIKIFRIIALAAVIGFSFASCDDGN